MTVKVGHGFLKGFRQEVSTAVEHFKNEGMMLFLNISKETF